MPRTKGYWIVLTTVTALFVASWIASTRFIYAMDELPKESVLPLSLANKAMQAALEACKKDGHRVSVSVVDRAGVLRTMARADGAGPHTVDSSIKKAYTASSLRRPTTELAELIHMTDQPTHISASRIDLAS